MILEVDPPIVGLYFSDFVRDCDFAISWNTMLDGRVNVIFHLDRHVLIM